MTPEELAYFEQFYQRARNRAQQNKQPWAMTTFEWLTWWNASAMRAAKMASPLSVIVMQIDPSLPWTPDNMRAMTKNEWKQETNTPRKGKAGLAVPKNPTMRVLSRRQWIEELRAEQDHK
ncbi:MULTISPECIES: hypothetical protein [unclassified Rhizobium]|uniref:hypothetical protein n=1 Tax=unclassified Rhizobium TaxID=2613769 RepID=UPI00115E5A63|nr:MULTISPECIES: hypothetical protein [unclassified Rhizobium]TQX90242.1 hypothetical protein EQW76_11100 [Rhizobium sp. rho-13.1]TQY16192.1 hypothetical protein EQW74_10690 [Rhizobium sp. rho-1.1]